MLIQTTMKCHLTLMKMNVIRRAKITCAVENVEKRLSHTADGNTNQCSYYGKLHEGFSKN